MMYTFYTKEELVKFTSVTDKEVNALLQMVREKVSNRYLICEQEHTTYRWFRRPLVSTTYIMLCQGDDGQCQVINFYADKCGLNYNVSKGYIMTYLCGLLNGKEISVQRY